MDHGGRGKGGERDRVTCSKCAVVTEVCIHRIEVTNGKGSVTSLIVIMAGTYR